MALEDGNRAEEILRSLGITCSVAEQVRQGRFLRRNRQAKLPRR